MKHAAAMLLSLALLLTSSAGAQNLRPRLREVVAPPACKEQFRLYLLIGQSNMAGRGGVAAQDTVPDPRVLRLNQAGQWEVAKDPVHFDKPVAGVGPGLSFGKTLVAQAAGITVGLIPCAVGGSALAVWQPGVFYPATNTYPYDDALARAKAAMQHGTLAGILWHQGESDSNPAGSQAYAQNLTELIARLRQDLQAPTVPFVAGQLPAFQLEKTDSLGRKTTNAAAGSLNQAVASLARTVPHYAYIRAEGTHDTGDHIHLAAASARLMGQRYARAMRRLQAKIKRPKRS
ncbi:sialate O-acetylesterase [Hymenobacter sp. BT188]|uniref:sialate O-acetylesterase n=1 Tax=Hymenobacter sp. BT188 TaxID=2763504 RepID=UPI00165169D9|nr:sialate O-acetylesterase [Hymenobacter sp. BT188]MBC6608855.1 sialate O-acetylesterase [Hymenobacter sp. BT188]